jgi:putative addiction module killer protein
MIAVRKTAEFIEWFENLADRRAIERIAVRLARLEGGLFGDATPVGEGVSELRIDYGPG